MIWIERLHLLFVHNPKCAGTAIHKALAAAFPDTAAAWGRRYLQATDGIQDLAHMTIAEGRTHFGIAGDIRSFGFVRDPYARFTSGLLHLRHWNRDFAKLTPDELAFELLDEERIRCDWKFIHFAPQYRFFYEGPVRTVGHIWKTEQLPAAWDEVQRSLGFSASLASENALSGHDSVKLSDAVVARINLLYARDFALFDYPRRRTWASGEARRMLYPKFAKLWPERRKLKTDDTTES